MSMRYNQGSHKHRYEVMKPNLTENQKKMLLRFFQGDYPSPTIEGYFWVDDPMKKVDGGTLSSLIKRGFVSARSRAGFYGFLSQDFHLTEQGETIAKELDEAAYQKRRAQRGW